MRKRVQGLNRLLLGVAVTLLACGSAQAEPYLAAKTGLKCGTCHVNATGGGMRTPFGNSWAQTSLPVEPHAPDKAAWTGQLGEYFAAGGNLRASAVQQDVPNADTSNAFELEEARVYLGFSPVPGRVDVYIDQYLGPGGSLNREAYARLRTADQAWYLKAGQFYLPFGWRLEDDSAFVRTASGINMTTPDRGVELGWETAAWSTQLAVSNGTAGGAEVDTGKQFSARTERLFGSWRLGASLNLNDTELGDRQMSALHAAVRTGSVTWLAEVDFIDDETVAGEPAQQAWLLEANWEARRGHNLKLTAEQFEPDDGVSGDEQERISLVWEYSPLAFTQLRLGLRDYSGPAANDLANRSELFVQLHGFY
ncbi:MAG: porin [Gammaproteobacteria bacterium]|nr:porin [Gammaproteobacteria bacterium]